MLHGEKVRVAGFRCGYRVGMAPECRATPATRSMCIPQARSFPRKMRDASATTLTPRRAPGTRPPCRPRNAASAAEPAFCSPSAFFLLASDILVVLAGV